MRLRWLFVHNVAHQSVKGTNSAKIAECRSLKIFKDREKYREHQPVEKAFKIERVKDAVRPDWEQDSGDG